MSTLGTSFASSPSRSRLSSLGQIEYFGQVAILVWHVYVYTTSGGVANRVYGGRYHVWLCSQYSLQMCGGREGMTLGGQTAVIIDTMWV